jgi:hypothetical protein
MISDFVIITLANEKLFLIIFSFSFFGTRVSAQTFRARPKTRAEAIKVQAKLLSGAR